MKDKIIKCRMCGLNINRPHSCFKKVYLEDMDHIIHD